MRKHHPASIRSRPSPLERALPQDFRSRLEAARLELRALFRAADQLGIASELPEEILRLFELDADFAEALHVMDIPPYDIDVYAMLRDTENSLATLAPARSEFLAKLEGVERRRLDARAAAVRATLLRQDAYIDIPGRDPRVG
jgi:hypothetical protein